MAMTPSKYITLSTAHITEEDAAFLTRLTEDPALFETDRVSVYPKEDYGWFIFCHETEHYQTMGWADLSPAFQMIHYLILSQGADLLILDPNGTINPDIPTFDW